MRCMLYRHIVSKMKSKTHQLILQLIQSFVKSFYGSRQDLLEFCDLHHWHSLWVISRGYENFSGLL